MTLNLNHYETPKSQRYITNPKWKTEYITVNGEQKPVVVGNHDLDAYEMWSEEEKLIIYNMMNSLNDVIQSIVSHENFSEYQN